MASERLRKTFHYPSSDESDDEAIELDEEQQERLIEYLQTQDANKNNLYRNIFLSIPVLTVLLILYVWRLAPSSTSTITTLLSISSLVASAYILRFMPLKSPSRKGKTPVYQVDADKGPVERYMVPLNGALCLILLVGAFVSGSHAAWMRMLPAMIFGMTLYVRQTTAPIDLEELSRSRYELRGA